MYQGTNDFAVTVRSTQISGSVPGHTATNTIQYTYERNHHSIRAALRKMKEKDTTIIDLIAGILDVNSSTGVNAAPLVAPQEADVTSATMDSSLGLDMGTIAEGQVLTKPIGIDTASEVGFLLTWNVGKLDLRLIDPSGRVITPTTVDPNIVYGEESGGDPSSLLPWTGSTASYTIQAPVNGQWQVRIAAAADLPGNQANWMLITNHDSNVTVSVAPDATWKAMNSTVHVTSAVKVGGRPWPARP